MSTSRVLFFFLFVLFWFLFFGYLESRQPLYAQQEKFRNNVFDPFNFGKVAQGDSVGHDRLPFVTMPSTF